MSVSVYREEERDEEEAEITEYEGKGQRSMRDDKSCPSGEAQSHLWA